MSHSKDPEVWAKPLAGGDIAVGLFNRGPEGVTVTTKWPTSASAAMTSGARRLRGRAERGGHKDGILGARRFARRDPHPGEEVD